MGFAFAGLPIFAASAGGLALLAAVLRRWVVPAMDSLGTQIQAHPASTIARFRRLHVTAILINLGQLVLIVASLMALSLRLR